jgi:hypothetical protein
VWLDYGWRESGADRETHRAASAFEAMARTIIAETSPLRYLFVMGEADLLCGEWDGVDEARRPGLSVTGILGVLARCADPN